ncbi:MAG: radical SAM protein [Gammaproteobacteria bacterium]|nr:radical SAM protein [Gammaproteobacteria bacterium]MBU1625451.1 radical SAM protein [Gammaproteobacteria bacterium]MBU1981711.1 radical SAM protein [Gammaproteobacteria bacterium]
MSLNYDMPLFRPPSEGDNLIIQATLGCSFNQCSFCAMYRSKQYVERPLHEVIADIRTAAADWPDAQRVFLADGDALALPTEHLLAILRELNTALPRLTRVSCYATPGNLARKSIEELVQLREHKLNLLYFGIESGSDLILKKITKGATQTRMAEVLHKAKDSGMKVSATVILGLGGTQHSNEHIDGTIALLNSAPVTYLSTLQLYLDESVEAEFHRKFGEPFQMPDDLAILKEQQRLISGLYPPQPVIFRSNHASNALALAGNLPKDKDKLLAQLQEAIAGHRPLRPLFMRGL